MAATGRSERSSHSIEQPEIIDRSDRKNSEGTVKEDFPLTPTKQPGSGSSSSLSLLELSDFVQVGAHIDQPEAGTICLGNPDHVIYQLQFKDDGSDASSISSSKSEKGSGFQGPTSASHESVGNVMSPTQSPPLQMMDRVGEYDPFRIPSAVFQRSRSITPLEWSIASNESLFSINVGNNSLSRDQAFRLSDLGKPDDLTTSDELFVLNPPPTVITSRETEERSAEFEKETKMGGTAEYTINDEDGAITGGLSERKVPPPAISWNSSNVSRHSDRSRSQSSSNSFAFPIKKKCACSSCYCSNCSRTFCYNLWPRCYSTWPCCCCWICSRALCYCWNCSRKGFCCRTSNILADEGAQAGSVPADAKKKHEEIVGVPSKPPGKSWFPASYVFPWCSCFSCCTWSLCSCSSCWKWSCCSCSCFKWNCSCSSCCKLSFCSCSSCFTWSCCHFFPSCHYRPSCHCC